VFRDTAAIAGSRQNTDFVVEISNGFGVVFGQECNSFFDRISNRLARGLLGGFVLFGHVHGNIPDLKHRGLHCRTHRHFVAVFTCGFDGLARHTLLIFGSFGLMYLPLGAGLSRGIKIR